MECKSYQIIIMKTIGLIGGMSWESSIEYYSIINTQIKLRVGGLHSAKILMYSVDFAEIEHRQRLGDWNSLSQIMISAAQILDYAGANCILMCANTMHKVASDVAKSINIPLIHIADATASVIQKDGIKKVALLGTKYTMEEDFFKSILINNYGLEVVIPNDKDRQIIHDVIYTELCNGTINKQSKLEYIRIVNSLKEQGIEGVILGCTEIGLLVQECDLGIATYDTALIHAMSAVDFALG